MRCWKVQHFFELEILKVLTIVGEHETTDDNAIRNSVDRALFIRPLSNSFVGTCSSR
jgi:hypothetical protein